MNRGLPNECMGNYAGWSPECAACGVRDVCMRQSEPQEGES